MDDEALVRQVLQGNLGAYGELVTGYTAQIAALCRAHIHRADVVEDLVQETFLRGLDRLASLREPGRFGFWLYAIARNLCLDWLNDPHHRHLPLDATPPNKQADPKAADADDRPDRIADLKQCIRHLPVAEREVVEIYYGGNRVTYKELAERLGVSFGQVNKLLSDARKNLRVCLEHADGTTSQPA